MEQTATVHALEKAEANRSPEDWKMVANLTCSLKVALPIPALKVRDLLQLEVGSVLDTLQNADSALPVEVNGTVIGWGELDAAGPNLAVRLTELR